MIVQVYVCHSINHFIRLTVVSSMFCFCVVQINCINPGSLVMVSLLSTVSVVIRVVATQLNHITIIR